MKHTKNPRDAAIPGPPPQQYPLAASSVPELQQQNPFSAQRSAAQTHPAAPKTSPGYVIIVPTSAAPIAHFLIGVAAIRNRRKQLKTIATTQF